MNYRLEYITTLPEPSATCEDVARQLAVGDELFSSKFVTETNDGYIVGTPEYPTFMKVTSFGEPPKPAMFCIEAQLDDPRKLELQRYEIGHTLRETLSAVHVYLVHDDVSRHIAVELHPKLSHIERQLRTFLNRFFSKCGRTGLASYNGLSGSLPQNEHAPRTGSGKLEVIV